MLLRLFIATLWSPDGKGADLLDHAGDIYCIFVTLPCGVLSQVWYLMVSIPDLCRLSYFKSFVALLIVFYCVLAVVYLFVLFVFPCDAMGWSVVCNCSIS